MSEDNAAPAADEEDNHYFRALSAWTAIKMYKGSAHCTIYNVNHDGEVVAEAWLDLMELKRLHGYIPEMIKDYLDLYKVAKVSPEALQVGLIPEPPKLVDFERVYSVRFIDESPLPIPPEPPCAIREEL